MQHSRFLVLTGHLNDYPLSDLVGILRHQQKTGRLLIEYPNSPASFFFNEGELVDAQLDNLNGLQAVCVALAQPPSSFNFNPMIRPTRRSIENSLQKVVSELLGCWGESEFEVEQITPNRTSPQPELLAPSSSEELIDSALTNIESTPAFLALPPAPVNRFSRPILAMASAGLLLLGLSTVIAVTGAFGKRGLSAIDSPPSLQTSDDGSMPTSGAAQSQSLPNTEHPSPPRVQHTITKGKESTMGLEQSTRRESQDSPVKKRDTESLEKTAVALSTAKPETKAHEEQTIQVTSATHSVKVVLQIEGGRVAQASIANHRSGMEAYEALALRIARQRRYPSKGATQETVTIKVSPPE